MNYQEHKAMLAAHEAGTATPEQQRAMHAHLLSIKRQHNAELREAERDARGRLQRGPLECRGRCARRALRHLLTEDHMDDKTVEKFEAWGLLELFGHQRLAGKLSDQTIGGVHFIRIDVPAVGEVPAYTRFFTQGAIYGMTVTTEDVALRLASTLQARPVSAYELRRRRALAAADPQRQR